MEDKKHLSQSGIGPAYVASILILTITALLLNWFEILPVFQIPEMVFLTKLLSVICVVAGVFLWFNAVVTMKITQHIRCNELVTTGAYAWVRNPIYAAFMLVMWGALLWSGNLLLLCFCPVYHWLMTVMLKHTEEKWLTELYGKDYLDYCKKVNRCIPWPPRKDCK